MSTFILDDMRTMNASKLKEQCLSLLDNLESDGILITKRGKPVARLIPADSDCASLIGSMKDKIRINGDIFSVGANWDAQS